MPATQVNVEYFFRLLYETIFGPRSPLDFTALSAFIADLWLWIIFIGYALSVAGLLVIVYATMRLFELRKREEEFYSTLIAGPEEAGDMLLKSRGMQPLFLLVPLL